ncbi:MAG: hypothetical protein QOH60_4590 [Mycobacterium sp.]|jgi:hypothetical protein|nr:hypothetical protein [Mycobacterium sp.]
MTRLLAPLLLRIAELLDQSLYTVPDMEAPMPPRPANTHPFPLGKALR